MNFATDISWFWINFGWFSGDEFHIFKLDIGEVRKDWNSSSVDFITIFSLHIFRFIIAFGWSR